jgi:hypothetical protein
MRLEIIFASALERDGFSGFDPVCKYGVNSF